MKQQSTYLIRVKDDLCSGCGVCADLLPEYFKAEGRAIFINGGDRAEIHDDDVPIGDYLRANCPDKAVSLIPRGFSALAV